jgi:hypothetical protein
VIRRRFLQSAGTASVAVLVGVGVWWLFASGNAVAVTPPTPASQAVTAACTALTSGLPQTVDRQHRQNTTPRSPLTAAWGSPAIILSCGVPEPTVLVPGSKNYDPTADEAYVNGVAWLIERDSTQTRFTAANRAVYVEVRLPAAYPADTAAIADLSAAVIRAIPQTGGAPGPDPAPLPTN